jgi:adenylate kinase
MTAVRLVILGRQGSGKGTQAAHLVEAYGPVHISTGDMLRAAVAAGTELGLQAKVLMDAGDLVGDDLINSIVAERLLEGDVVERGFLLDGYPRTPDQATALEGFLTDAGTPLDAAVNLDVPVDEVTARMVARGRADDTEEGIRRRLDLYESETAPLLAWFAEHDLLDVVDGLADEETVFDRLTSVIDGRLSVGDARGTRSGVPVRCAPGA